MIDKKKPEPVEDWATGKVLAPSRAAAEEMSEALGIPLSEFQLPQHEE